MFRLIWITNIHPRDFLHRYMPTKIVVDKPRPRRNFKWGVPEMLLTIPYLVVADTMTILIGHGAPGGSTCWCCCASGTRSRPSHRPGERGAVGANPRC
ncbi:hypothetical protein M0E87_06590 [Corynebacterium sp. CCM 9185]|uniref:Uncharacterized protein n=2 Tax=Corynebacterium marambiense TaxID=2765364 RepID=A0ABS0VX72_9CORY|nr:hypothetical protein [Corynebacterium marambiense]MBI8999973.1 hypothetical protein [Corynebacterium marambiense]MCK7663327.1 hypothetical protein [Corynebacterium marambiense]MCX7542237.1 hypothetical protein [Corynebacterium marambiense]